jgi:hypothetical protein
MTQPTIDLRVDPADETIRLGPLAVRFSITGEDSNGSIAAFELLVPSAQRLTAPAHSHDHYEETIYGIAGVLTWTVDGKPIDLGPGRRGRESILRDHTGRHRSAVFPRVCRGHQRGRGRAAGPGEDDRDHAPPRPHAGSAAPGVTARSE